jgi:hypothetical protein
VNWERLFSHPQLHGQPCRHNFSLVQAISVLLLKFVQLVRGADGKGRSTELNCRGLQALQKEEQRQLVEWSENNAVEHIWRQRCPSPLT